MYWMSIERNIIVAVLVLDFNFILNYHSYRNIHVKKICGKNFHLGMVQTKTF